MNLTSLGTSCKWNPSVSALLCMASLKLPPVKKDCILVFARNPCICLVILMTVFAQCREKDDKNLPNHWLGRWVEVTPAFRARGQQPFWAGMPDFRALCFLWVKGQGWFQTPSEQVLPADAVGKEDRLLSCKLSWRDSFDFFQLQRKAWAQWQQVVITSRRSCHESDTSKGHQRRRELLYHSFHWKRSQLSEVVWVNDCLFGHCFSSF